MVATQCHPVDAWRISPDRFCTKAVLVPAALCLAYFSSSFLQHKVFKEMNRAEQKVLQKCDNLNLNQIF